ncbi:MAG: helical backbone metal receptor [Planctomycetota bacterium]
MLRAFLITVLALASACGGPPETALNSAPARRVASLSPAISSAMVALGWRDRVVGRTPWCDGLDATPVVGSLLEIDLERLAATKPDLVLVQRTASGMPAGLADAAASRGWRVAAVPCNSLDDVVGLGAAIEAVVGERAPNDIGPSAWREVLQPLATASHASPAILLLSAEPPMAFGRDAYLAELWSRWGGTTVPDAPGHPALSLEDLTSLKPRSIVLAGAPAGAEALAQACRDRGIAFVSVDDPRLLRPGPDLLDAAAAWRDRWKDGVR